jgi:hypothetical protein
MADLISDIISSPYFILFGGLLIGGVLVYFWLKGKEDKIPEKEVGYGKKLWNDITSKHLKNILALQGIKPHEKKKFIVGNEIYGNVNKYLHAFMLDTGEVAFSLKSYLQKAKEDRDLKLKEVEAEYERRLKEFESAKQTG